jgi:ubiquinone/menaquinone biosynthesis C-methylase UbiE
MPQQTRKAYKGLPLEGVLARWYARNTVKDLGKFKELAEALARRLPAGSSVLEVAPGPGYLAIELARLGTYRIVGLDISKTFVQMAAENAERAGVRVIFLHGNAAAMPFDPGSFDSLVCRAAFKNFAEPVRALNEMYRVLKPGGTALIIDLRRDASPADLSAYVKTMGLGWFNALLTRWIFKHSLVKRAYSEEQFRQMAAQTPFPMCDIKRDLIGLEVSLRK